MVHRLTLLDTESPETGDLMSDILIVDDERTSRVDISDLETKVLYADCGQLDERSAAINAEPPALMSCIGLKDARGRNRYLKQ